MKFLQFTGTDSRRIGFSRIGLIGMLLLVGGWSLFPLTTAAADFDARGGQFFGLKKLKDFTVTTGAKPGEQVLTSREFVAALPWNELIVSWNADMPTDSYLRVEARAVYPDRATKYYVMSLWSSNPAKYPRESVKRQKDADGDVKTDTLVLKRPSERFQIRLTMGGDAGQFPQIRFLGAHVLDTRVKLPPLPPNRAAWSVTLPVPERSQLAYEGGGVWCSPTTISMMLGYWANRLKRPELDHDLPRSGEGRLRQTMGRHGKLDFQHRLCRFIPRDAGLHHPPE